MRYREYYADIGGNTKKLGILGETHMYNKAESEFARTILPGYDLIAAEGQGDRGPGCAMGCASLILLPAFAAYVIVTRRTHPTALQIAKKEGYKMVHLEEDFPHPLPNTAYFILLGAAATVTIPALGILSRIGLSKSFSQLVQELELKSRKDREAHDAREAAHLAEVKNSKRVARDFLPTQASPLLIYSTDLHRRDDIMAYGAAAHLQLSDRVLVVCGDAHLDGIVARLADKLQLHETRRESV